MVDGHIKLAASTGCRVFHNLLVYATVTANFDGDVAASAYGSYTGHFLHIHVNDLAVAPGGFAKSAGDKLFIYEN